MIPGLWHALLLGLESPAVLRSLPQYSKLITPKTCKGARPLKLKGCSTFRQPGFRRGEGGRFCRIADFGYVFSLIHQSLYSNHPTFGLKWARLLNPLMKGGMTEALTRDMDAVKAHCEK